MAIQVNVDPITARTPPLADLLEQQWMPLVRLAALLVNDADTAPDIVQDCFEAVWRLRPTFDDDAHLAAYLRKAVINRSRSRLRRVRTANRYLAQARPSDEPPADRRLLIAERHRELRRRGGSPTAGECYPAESTTDPSCTTPAAWFNPTPEFLAAAPRDPATIAQQPRAESTAEQERRTGPNGGFTESPETFSDGNLAYLELNYLHGVLSSNGVPTDLSQALRQVVASMPNIQVTENMQNLLGERGTGYSLPNHKGELLTVIFTADGYYLGSPTEAVSHGIAPGLGEPPSRMLH